MNDTEFEKYCFLRLYSIDLNTSLHTIKVLGRYKRAEVQNPLVRDIAVTYARPFSGNKGDQLLKHQLSADRHVPKSAKELHRELVRLRMQQFAHTDLKFYHPRVAKFCGGSKPWFPMSFKSYDYRHLLSRISEIESLVREVEKSIHAEIATYEQHF